MPKILSIKTYDNVDGQEGYEVVTEDATYNLEVGAYDDCCADAGYFSTDDDPQYYVGADLLAMHRVTPSLERIKLPQSLDEGSAIFIDLVTNRGTLQLAVYNAHNGYYGNTARLTVAQRTRETLIEEQL